MTDDTKDGCSPAEATYDTGYLNVHVENLVPADWNYKTTNERLQGTLAASLKTLGQIETLLVRELEDGKLEVCNGNHRLQLMTPGAQVWVYNLGRVNREVAIAQAIKLNHTRFPSNDIKLNRAVARMKETGMGELEAAMPYTPDQINDMAAMASMTFEDYKPNPGTGQLKKDKATGDPTFDATLTGELADRWDIAKQEAGIEDDEAFFLKALEVINAD